MRRLVVTTTIIDVTQMDKTSHSKTSSEKNISFFGIHSFHRPHSINTDPCETGSLPQNRSWTGSGAGVRFSHGFWGRAPVSHGSTTALRCPPSRLTPVSCPHSLEMLDKVEPPSIPEGYAMSVAFSALLDLVRGITTMIERELGREEEEAIQHREVHPDKQWKPQPGE